MKTINIKDKTIPNLAIGTWHMGEDPSLNDQEIQTIKYGLDQGLKMIDTAEMYAYGKSEEIVGHAIKDFDREDLYLVSKVLPSNANKSNMEASLDASLARLGTDYLDLYLLHWQSMTPIDEIVEEFERLKAKGKILDWGVSNLDTPDIEEMLKVNRGENCLANQILYNLGERGPDYSLRPLTDKNNIVTMAYCPLAQNGRLDRDLLSNPVLLDVADDLDLSPQQILLAFIQAQDNIIPIVKTSKMDHMKDNIQSLHVVLARDVYDRLDEEFPAPDYKTRLAIK